MSKDLEPLGTYERTFVLAVRRERAWECFTDPAERAAWLEEPDAGTDDHYTVAGGTPGYGVVINEAVPLERLRWTEAHAEPDGSIEICVVFEDADTGTRITITQARFGEIDDDQLRASDRGWAEAMADLAFYLRTGIRVRRHATSRGAIGVMFHEALEGVEVTAVLPGGYGADVGLQPGDLLLDLAGTPIFSMAEIWTVLREHGEGERLAVRYVRGNELYSGDAALSGAAAFPQ